VFWGYPQVYAQVVHRKKLLTGYAQWVVDKVGISWG